MGKCIPFLIAKYIRKKLYKNSCKKTYKVVNIYLCILSVCKIRYFFNYLQHLQIKELFVKKINQSTHVINLKYDLTKKSVKRTELMSN